MQTHRVGAGGEHGARATRAQVALHQAADAQREAELDVLLEVGAQVAAVELVGGLEVSRWHHASRLRARLVRQQRAQPLYKQVLLAGVWHNKYKHCTLSTTCSTMITDQ